jgi:hypothetical protein
MFKCSFCGKTASKGTPCKKVTKTVIFHHPFRSKVQRRWGFDKSGRPKLEWIDDKGGVGPQIVSEHPICPDCAVVRRIV